MPDAPDPFTLTDAEITVLEGICRRRNLLHGDGQIHMVMKDGDLQEAKLTTSCRVIIRRNNRRKP
jgi:hypothetical protein